MIAQWTAEIIGKMHLHGITQGILADKLMIDYIDRKERLKINYSIAQAKVERIERGLEALTKNERRVLELLVLRRYPSNIDRLCGELGYEQAQVYRIQQMALRTFALAMFGVTDL